MDRDERIRELLTRGVEQILPSKEAVQKKLESSGIMTVYCGFDPTAPTLHLGHAIQLRKLRQFQDLGHKVIFLIGDFTARIGDPTDKSAARTTLTEREIKNNLRLYKKQAGKFIRFTGKNAATVRFNNKWLGKMKFADVLSLAAHMTVDQMLKRDMFVRRMNEEKPIYLHEFLYPLMQGYDSVALGVDGEIGGNDQLFNMLAGRTLLQHIKQRDKFVIADKLLVDGNGKKMGKSEGNMVALSDAPQEMYGKVMSWGDDSIALGFELCTDMSMRDIETFLSSTTHPKEQKERLAFEIVKSVYDETAAVTAATHFTETFREGKIPESVDRISRKETFKETILGGKVISSAAELRRLAEQGAINNLTDGSTVSVDALSLPPVSGVYRIGKKRFVHID